MNVAADEYIRRKDVAEMLENAAIISNGEFSGYCTEDVSLDSIPTADVAPVRHGYWHFVGKVAQCSRCLNRENMRGYSRDDWKKFAPFCRACGAIMVDKGKVFYDG